MATIPADRKRNWMLVGALAAVIYGFGNLYQPTVVVGQSMAPTLESGRVIWLDRTYYRTHRPKVGEVIVFKDEAGETYVKRVYRGPGETVHYLASGSQFLMPVRDPFASALRVRYEHGRTSLRVKSMKVPEDSVFVLGDNYVVSIDSRQLGAIPLRAIVGRAHLPVDAAVAMQSEFAPKPVSGRFARSRAAQAASTSPQQHHEVIHVDVEKVPELIADPAPTFGERASVPAARMQPIRVSLR